MAVCAVTRSAGSEGRPFRIPHNPEKMRAEMTLPNQIQIAPSVIGVTKLAATTRTVTRARRAHSVVHGRPSMTGKQPLAGRVSVELPGREPKKRRARMATAGSTISPAMRFQTENPLVRNAIRRAAMPAKARAKVPRGPTHGYCLPACSPRSSDRPWASDIVGRPLGRRNRPDEIVQRRGTFDAVRRPVKPARKPILARVSAEDVSAID